MNPWGATSTSEHTPARSAAAATLAASSAGRTPARLASGSAPLAWKSTPGRLDGRSTGSAPGSTVSKACWRRSARMSCSPAIPPWSPAQGKKGNRFAPPARSARPRRAPLPCRPSWPPPRHLPLRFDAVDLDRLTTPVLHHVDWQVGPGERWVVLGPNGSGKTTLFELASGYLHPTRGTVDILGHRLGRVDVRRLREHIGLVSTAVAKKLVPAHHRHRRGRVRPARGPRAVVAPLRRRGAGPGPRACSPTPGSRPSPTAPSACSPTANASRSSWPGPS